MLRSLDVERLLGRERCRERDLVVAMICQRLLEPGSKLSATRRFAQTTLGEELSLGEVTEPELLAAMDWLSERQDRIERTLARRHLPGVGDAHAFVLYDLSSSYVEGRCCPLATLGYSRAAVVAATGLALYGRKLWETMSSHWPTADQQPGATPAAIEFARRWRDMPKVLFSSTISTVDWNTRLVTGDAVTEIARLKAEDGGPMDIGGATLAAAAMRAGLIDEYAIVTNGTMLREMIDSDWRPAQSAVGRSAGSRLTTVHLG